MSELSVVRTDCLYSYFTARLVPRFARSSGTAVAWPLSLRNLCAAVRGWPCDEAVSEVHPTFRHRVPVLFLLWNWNFPNAAGMLIVESQ